MPLLTSFVPTIHPSGRVGRPGSVFWAGFGVNICEPSAFLMLENLPIWNWLWDGQVEIGFGPTLPFEIQSTSEVVPFPKTLTPIMRKCGLLPSFG